MPWTHSFPFRRLRVDHAARGVTTVWWELMPEFNDPEPRRFQLQVGFTGLPNAIDWLDVGDPVEDAWMLQDSAARLEGKRSLTHYRVKCYTPRGVYVSNPVGCYGDMPEDDWLLCKEIVRKEILRLGLTGQQGWLFKRFRFGARCERCLDPVTRDVQDSTCPQCGGTGFKVGYHPPSPMMCWDISGESIREQRAGMQPPGPTRNDVQRVRAVAFPDLAKEDIWVARFSDKRYLIEDVTHVAAWRGVPVVFDVTAALLPFTHPAYRMLRLGDEAAVPTDDPPTSGSGCVLVDHNYGGADALTYQTAAGCGVEGATIMAFTASDYANGARTPHTAAAVSSTTAGGRWALAMQLDPGEYVLVFRKAGEFEDAVVSITVAAPAVDSSASYGY